MEKVSKSKCSLEEEYAFEHKARIKAENYISELWEMHGELEKEVLRLQKIINDKEYEKEKKVPLSDSFKLKKRVKKIHKERKGSLNKLTKLIKGALK